MSLVLDSSVTVAWYFPDEGNEATDGVLRQVASAGAVVPGHWRAEVANAFQMAIRRKRVDVDYRDRSLASLKHFEITIDQQTNTHMWDATLRLAEQTGLTVYDAAYLELAQRRRLSLASLDQALRDAATAAGVPTLG